MKRAVAWLTRALVLLSCVAAARGELIYGLTAQGVLINFDSATPGSVNTVGNVTGASSGQLFLNLDFRPANGLLYGLAVNTITGASNIYTINTATAAATMVGNTPFTLSVSIGGRVAMDFNPVTDHARVVSRNGSNYQVNPITGALSATNTTLNYAPAIPAAAAFRTTSRSPTAITSAARPRPRSTGIRLTSTIFCASAASAGRRSAPTAGRRSRLAGRISSR